MSGKRNYVPRGYRNLNPTNIRKTSGKPWVGEIQPSLDPQFKQFKTMAYGYRAALMLIRNYIRKYGCNTVRKIINRWAPASENNTAAYVKAVCQETGLDSSTVIDADDKETLCGLVAAMSYVENGCLANMDDVRKGWELL